MDELIKAARAVLEDFDLYGQPISLRLLAELRKATENAAQQSVQPTVLTHSPNCALVRSLVADCNCHLAKSHSG